jgi:hydroxymethylpyrimidine pyrophosphatase-like HAD family hydrolase
MGNALPAVQAAAQRLTRTHNEAGVAQVVGWILDGDA